MGLGPISCIVVFKASVDFRQRYNGSAEKELKACALLPDTLNIEQRNRHIPVMLLQFAWPQGSLDPCFPNSVIISLVGYCNALFLALGV